MKRSSRWTKRNRPSRYYVVINNTYHTKTKYNSNECVYKSLDYRTNYIDENGRKCIILPRTDVLQPSPRHTLIIVLQNILCTVLHHFYLHRIVRMPNRFLRNVLSYRIFVFQKRTKNIFDNIMKYALVFFFKSMPAT